MSLKRHTCLGKLNNNAYQKAIKQFGCSPNRKKQNKTNLKNFDVKQLFSKALKYLSPVLK